MKNILNVSSLDRTTIKALVPKASGIYRWWFDKDTSMLLLSVLNLSINDKKIQSMKIEGRTYYALYFGISKDLQGRIRWHVLQKHTLSAVKSGTLSTLRQTLCALLKTEMLKGEYKVNDLIRQHCYWEWEENITPCMVEKQALSSPSYYYPLNIQENKSIQKEVISRLKNLRKEYKK